jgi:hypothetical protein
MTGLESGKKQIGPQPTGVSILFEEPEKIELAEDLFGTDVPVDLAFDNPREIVDYLRCKNTTYAWCR